MDGPLHMLRVNVFHNGLSQIVLLLQSEIFGKIVLLLRSEIFGKRKDFRQFDKYFFGIILHKPVVHVCSE